MQRFFVVGQWVDKYPESVKALHDAGNEVMSHSDDHAHFAQLSADEIKSNITASNEKIKKITGTEPTLFRCPYGEYNDTVISTVNSMGMSAIQWDVGQPRLEGDIGKRYIRSRAEKREKRQHSPFFITPPRIPRGTSWNNRRAYCRRI